MSDRNGVGTAQKSYQESSFVNLLRALRNRHVIFKILLVTTFSIMLLAPGIKDASISTVQGQTSNQLTVTTATTGGEDTFVASANPTSNYGQRTTVEVDNDPVKRSLLRFNVTGLPTGSTITSVVLRLYVYDYSSTSGTVSAVLGSWSEGATNWASAPAVGAAIASLTNPATVGTWVQATVTPAVTGNGVINFYITTTNSNGVDYYSGENTNTANHPALVITYVPPAGPSLTPSDSPTPTNSPTPTLSPTPTPSPTVGPSSTATATPTPSLRPSASDPILIGAGDVSSCSNNNDEIVAQLIEAAFANGATGKVFVAGDVVYESGTTAEFMNCYHPTWGRFRNNSAPAVGNHEYLTTGASGYYNYFGSLGGDPTKGYYSYNLGTWHIVVINSNCSKVGGCHVGSPQEKWMRADLAANPSACAAAYWHHPRYSSGPLGNFTSMIPIWQALLDFNADVVIAGHDHMYERFAPQDAMGNLDLARGIREFMVGTGGKNHISFSSTIKPNSEARNDKTFGVLKLTLHSNSYDWQFIPEPGKTFTDSGTQACH